MTTAASRSSGDTPDSGATVGGKPAVVHGVEGETTGFAAVKGPYEPCMSDTGASCMIFSCPHARGPTACGERLPWTLRRPCLCSPGYCSVEGMCVRSDEVPRCSIDLRTSCLSLRSERRCNAGPSTCFDSMCLCDLNMCACGGRCRHSNCTERDDFLDGDDLAGLPSLHGFVARSDVAPPPLHMAFLGSLRWPLLGTTSA
eukprot:CAMPEP_0117616124 /NCGR_PEP_ID=MMETSP0784-20121206/84885_1 /TAXON_ID=39447 /ORGANISM="" /LENGTH=199 /DNA_ID=CAMNT_0005419865 /DNA_START=67 /DNA_END=666 /DNA_ORIENTATION=-